jgi:outer membrane protein OmpA-like peptidoglycan-associated protein
MRTRTLAFVAVAASSLLSTAARAEDGFAVNRFEPSERGSDWFSQESLDLRGKNRLSAGIITEWNYKSLLILAPDASVRSSVVRHQINLHPGVGFIFMDRFRLALSVPVQIYGDGKAGTDARGVFWAAPQDSVAFGDVRLSLDARLVGEYNSAFTGALGVSVWLPTGSRDNYTSDHEVRVEPRYTIAGTLGGSFIYAAKIGYRFRSREIQFEDTTFGNEITWGLGLGVRASDSITLGPELFGSTYSDRAFKQDTTFQEALFGTKFTIEKDWRIGAALGAGITRVPSSPDARASLSIEWFPAIAEPPPDRDNDGVPDDKDACPDVAGVKTDDPKTNGCPPPKPGDRDGDGVTDDEDACPDVAGVRTSDPKTNGCPPDRDHDGIPDDKDACPDVPGVKSDDPKRNGCPPDSDGDGIIDSEDACPNVPGIKTNDPKTNGCPDPDRDHDGIPNDVDACPDEPGPKSDDPKKNGCPIAQIVGTEIKINDQVKFKTNSAEILPGKESEDVLKAVSKILKEHPEIKKVKVEGHTDNVGNANYNKTLSGNRAASVVKWLVKDGIAADRLTSAGMGQDKPIDTNTTEEGRKNNRRVEFHIEQKDESAAPKAPEPKK